jgi:hypothetical protein
VARQAIGDFAGQRERAFAHPQDMGIHDFAHDLDRGELSLCLSEPEFCSSRLRIGEAPALCRQCRATVRTTTGHDELSVPNVFLPHLVERVAVRPLPCDRTGTDEIAEPAHADE